MNKYLKYLLNFIGVLSIFVIIILYISVNTKDHSKDEYFFNLAFMYDISSFKISAFSIIQSLSFMGIFMLGYIFSMDDIIRTDSSFLRLILYRQKSKVNYINSLVSKIITSNLLFSIIIVFSCIIAFVLFGNFKVFNIKLVLYAFNLFLLSSSIYVMTIYIKFKFDSTIATLFYFITICMFFILDMSIDKYSILKFSKLLSMFFGSLISLLLFAVSYLFVARNAKNLDLL